MIRKVSVRPLKDSVKKSKMIDIFQGLLKCSPSTISRTDGVFTISAKEIMECHAGSVMIKEKNVFDEKSIKSARLLTTYYPYVR